MSVTASIIMTGIAIGLLLIYGADVAATYSSDAGQGFLPFDEKARGFGLGIPSLVLPIAGYFISRNKQSKPLGSMIIIAGILILIGGTFVLGNSNSIQGSERNIVAESVPLIVAGGFIIGLGIIKLKRS
ncbi:MAG: hypothetical protein GWN01_11855 [Nitrosopumilaceae archaeon]|nr:hypothetical protein [Nitrosopumilaceae archaeon]NIU01570.1 hypothetical protein [Nitrosopumilaceae archaeon]NIU88551.1 hypothetical protein [Nitrosopumilaceae archaeon]NIV66256.1 hypothetical protein [Nitrosopumilaceae archaeon]NIX62172.1 hypothetical protein [Nitrosopumilaceae archaeon]